MYNMRTIDLNAKYKTPNIDALTKQEAKLSIQKENSKNNEEPLLKSQIPPRTQMSYEIRTTPKYIEPDIKISTENRAKIWAMILKNNKHSSKLAVDDNEILRTVLKLPNQRVIKSDCSRTRTSLFDDKLKESLEYLITYYCIKENITYKQGLNEVAAPFVSFMKSGLQISTVYNYFALFMERFLPNIFTDQDFLSMQCCFRILVVLIKYHDPQLYHFLKINDLPPELYATPWFLTLFASKLSIDMVLLLWDSLLIENDQSFVFFISLALLHLYKAKIMASDPSIAPQTLTGLTIETPEEYRRVLKKAYELRSKTPESFVYFIRGLDIFARNYSHDQIGIKKMHFNIEYLSYWEFFFMQPFEFIKYLNPRRIQCANLACPSNEKQQQQTKKSSGQDAFSKTDDFNARGRKSFQEMSGLTNDTAFNSKLECEFCADKFRKLPKELQVQIQAVPHMREVVGMSTALSRQELEFLIIDLRIERDHDDGIMPKSQIFDIKNFNEDSVSKLMDDLIELRNNFHFCFMIDRFESANIQSTKATENDSSEILRRFVNYFIDNNFSHISILEGGFKAIHDMSLRMNSDILFHNQSKCRTCQGKNSEEWNIGNSLMSLFNQVFRDTSKKLTDFRLFTEVSPKNPKIKQTLSLSPGHQRRHAAPVNSMANIINPFVNTLNTNDTNQMPELRKILEESDRSYLSGEENIDSARNSNLRSNQTIDSSQLYPTQLLTSAVTSSRDIPTDKSMNFARRSYNEPFELSNASKKFLNERSTTQVYAPMDTKTKRQTETVSTQSPIRSSQAQALNASRYVFTATSTPITVTTTTTVSTVPSRKDSTASQRMTSSDASSRVLTQEDSEANKQFSKTYRPLTSSGNYLAPTKTYSTPKNESFRLNSGTKQVETPQSAEDENRGKNPQRKRINASDYQVGGISASYIGTTNHQPDNTSLHSSGITTTSTKYSMISPREYPHKYPNDVSMPLSQVLDDKKKVENSDSSLKTSYTPTVMVNNMVNGGNLSAERESVKKSIGSFEKPESSNSALRGVAKNIPLQSSSKFKMEGDMDFFRLNGIRRIVTLEDHEPFTFLKLLELYPKITLYVSDFVKSSCGNEEQKSSAKPEARSKRILILTRDLFFSIDYESKFHEYLQYLQQGVGTDKILAMAKNNTLKTVVSPLKTSTLPNNYESQKLGIVVNIRAMFPIKFLLRITSKKYDPSYLSFYFKIPNVESIQLEQYKPVLDRFTKWSLLIFYDYVKSYDFLATVRQVLEKKDGKEMSQSKHLYVIEGDSMAKECIATTRDYYNEASTALVKKRPFNPDK